MSAIYGGDSAPFRAKFPGYGPCQKMRNKKGGKSLPVYILVNDSNNNPPGKKKTDTGALPLGSPQDYINTYVPDPAGSKIVLAPCNDVGAMIVFGARKWHGRFGFKNPEGAATMWGTCTSGDVTQYVSYEPSRAHQNGFTPPQTKYCVLTAVAKDIQASNCGTMMETWDYEATYSCAVNKLSGVATWAGSGSTAGRISDLLNMANGDMKTGWQSLGYTNSLAPGFLYGGDQTLTGDGITGWHGHSTTTYNGNTVDLEDWTFNPYSVSRTLYGTVNGGCSEEPGPDDLTWGPVYVESLTIIETVLSSVLSYSLVTYGNQYDPQNSRTLSLVATLSAPNAWSDVIVDINTNLFPLWNLLDRTLMPLTTYSFDGKAIKVSRLEMGPTTPTINLDLPAPATYYDGSILGAPLANNPAVPGLDAGGVPQDYWSSELGFKGGYSNGWLPPRCTQWTTGLEMAGRQIGRSIQFNVTPEGGAWVNPDPVIWASKWIESSLRLPSYNFARPCGLDRSKYPNCPPFCGRLEIQGIVDNLPGEDTRTVTTDAMPVLNQASGLCPLFNLDFCAADMTPIATNVTPATINLTSFKVTASAASLTPAKWVTLYGAVTGDPPVPVYDKNNNAPGSHAGDTGQNPTGAPVDWIPTYVPKWYWADNKGKGQFVLTELVGDLRTGPEIARLGSVYDCDGDVCGCTTPPSPMPVPTPTNNRGFYFAGIADKNKGWVNCGAWLIMLSPNTSDTPPAKTGSRYDFTQTVLADERYGTQQWLDVSQLMVDPLDNSGGCFVEARAILPHAGGLDSAPDNGAGIAQNEDPPTIPKDFTLLSPMSAPIGSNVFAPPAMVASDSGGQAQAAAFYVPAGTFPACDEEAG